MFSIDTFRKMLTIQKHRLDDELEVQSDVMDRISAQVALLNSRQLEAKDTLSRVEARLFAEQKEDKVSNELANAEVKKARDRSDAWNKYQQARQEYEEWAGLLEAWRARGYHIKVMSDLYIAQYFQLDSTGSGTRMQQGDGQPNFRRAEMRAASTWKPPAPPPPKEEAAPVVRRRPLT